MGRRSLVTNCRLAALWRQHVPEQIVGIPFLLLDLFVTVFQAVCFPIYGIPKIKRADYLVFDRHHLAYLNALEKLNSAYCSYANGLIAFLVHTSQLVGVLISRFFDRFGAANPLTRKCLIVILFKLGDAVIAGFRLFSQNSIRCGAKFFFSLAGIGS